MYYFGLPCTSATKKEEPCIFPELSEMVWQSFVKSLNNGAGTTREPSEGNLARRMQATDSPCLMAVLSERWTGDRDLNVDGHVPVPGCRQKRCLGSACCTTEDTIRVNRLCMGNMLPGVPRYRDFAFWSQGFIYSWFFQWQGNMSDTHGDSRSPRSLLVKMSLATSWSTVQRSDKRESKERNRSYSTMPAAEDNRWSCD